MTKNIDNLLRIALKDSITDITKHAFDIITKYYMKFNNALLDSGSLSDISHEILKPGTSCLQISKFAIIIQVLFKSCPKKAIEKIPWITDFLKFTQHSAVITLFSELLKAKDEEVVIFDYLVDLKLPFLVADAINKAEDINSDNVAVTP